MNIFILGRKYQGKSTLAIHLALQIKRARNGYRIVVFDPKWQTKVFPYTDNIDEFRDFLYNRDIDVDGATFFPARRFSDDDSEQVQKDFTEFCEAIGMDAHLKNPPARPLIVVIDEAYYLQGKGYLHPWLGRMIRLATEGKLYIIQAGHRPVDLTPDVRGKGDEFFFFRQTDPADLRIVTEICGEDCADAVASLDKHHVLRYDVNRLTREAWRDPDAWYMDIGGNDERRNTGEPVAASA